MQTDRALALLFLVLVLAGRVSQTDAQDALPTAAGRLGIAHISSIDVPRTEERYQRALTLGASWNRWPLYWDRVEAPDGSFDWSAYDALVADDLSHDLALNVVLLGIPAQHRAEDSVRGLDEPVFADGADTPAPGKAVNPDNPWARFVRAAVERYRPGGILSQQGSWTAEQGVRVWEIWNEPDYAFFWSGSVQDYARLLKVAYLVIKSVDPSAVVMLGGLLFPTQENFLARVLAIYQQDPAAEPNGWFLDAVAIHNYGDAWRSGWLTLVVRQTLVEYGLERRIWLTETGVPIWDDYPGPRWAADDPAARMLLATSTQQADFLIQSAAYAWAEGAETIIYHQLYDDCGNQPPGTDFPPISTLNACGPGEICSGDTFGMYRNPADAVCFAQHPQPDTARPVTMAFALLSDVFGQPFSRRGIVQDTTADDIIQITFIRPESRERIVVVWNAGETSADWSLEAVGDRAEVYSMTASRVLVPDSGGYALSLPAGQMPRQRFLSTRSSVDIGGSPLIVVETVLDDATWEQLVQGTFEGPNRRQEPLTTEPPQLSETQVAELLAQTEAQAIFVTQEASRLRNLPTTEGSQVVGTLAIGETLPITGRLTDSTWWQVEYEGELVWIASFLGDAYGAVDSVPVVDVTPLPATPSS